MAIPENTLSTIPHEAPFLPPRDIVVGFLESFHFGGLAINDASLGMNVQVWHATSDGTSVFLTAPNLPSPIELFTVVGSGISSIDLSFDQNMQPMIAYVEGGQAKLWWFDPVPNTFVHMLLGATDKNPRIALDDSRATQLLLGKPDVILGYTRDSSLYYRQQRDRFTVERLLKANTGLQRLLTIGMSEANRFQFFFGGDIPPFISPPAQGIF